MQDSYMKHVEQTGKLSIKLYPVQKEVITNAVFTTDDKLSLGANYATFPLITLMNGLTLLCANILAYKIE